MPSPDAEKIRSVLAAIRALDPEPVQLMEVCGTHTMAIAKAGIRSLLPDGVSLISGPGCPVCVTPPERIDAVLELSEQPGIVITTYGDMLRVPGSVRGDSLRRRAALGADVRIVYSPVDAVRIAQSEPQKQIVFLGVGFETTAPGTAAAVLTAAELGLKNFSLFSMLKAVEPSLRALTARPDVKVDGFLCPGHVATIVGERGFEFLPRDLGYPSVISGFEPEEILLSVYLLLKQIKEKNPRLQNAYRRAVAPQGNPAAMAMLKRCFTLQKSSWRGLGEIEASGYVLCPELREYDAEKRFGIRPRSAAPETGCRCGDVITGTLRPAQCPMFGTVCTPEDPLGPCMVSSEGACAAAYKYME